MARVDPRVGDIFAHLPGVRRYVRETTNSVAGRARAILTRSRDTGESRIEVSYGTTDGFVTLHDPHGGALAIEYGHVDRRTGRFIPGARPLRGAIGLG